MMDLDEQASLLEQVQFELQAAGYGTEQVADNNGLHLAVWHPNAPGRRATVTTDRDRDHGEPVYSSTFRRAGYRASKPSDVTRFMNTALGNPHQH